METAERLFGLHGIDGVSLRQINETANLANKSAIHYHFADRTDLVRRIWKYRLPILNSRRLILLRQARDRGQLDDPIILLSILAQPIYEFTDSNGHHTFSAYARHALRDPMAVEFHEDAEDVSVTVILDEIARVGRQSIPGFNRDVAWYRARYAMATFFDMVFERDHSPNPPAAVPKSEDKFFADGAAMMAAICFRVTPSAAKRARRAGPKSHDKA
jgi:AcrR family transcriptional regulator